LAVIHSRGLVHGDVKPSNIFWDNSKATLGDLAGVFSSADEDESAAGTVSYWAPEFTYSEPRHPPIDIWALGVSYFHMVTGDQLFDTYRDTETRYGGGLDDIGIPFVIENTEESSVAGHNDTTDELTHFRLTMLFHKILGPPPDYMLGVMSGFFTTDGRPQFAPDQEQVNLYEFLSQWATHNPTSTEQVIRGLLCWDPEDRPPAGKVRKLFASLPRANKK
jgi:serine/threonine protein kinase